MTVPTAGADHRSLPENSAVAFLLNRRASVTFAVITFAMTVAQVLVSPIAAYVDGRGVWTAGLSFPMTLAILTVGCAMQAGALVFSVAVPSLAVVDSVLCYFGVLFVVQAPSWLDAMQLVVALALFLLAARSSVAASVGWTLSVGAAGVAGLYGWAQATGASPSAVTGFVLSEGTRFALLAGGGAALGIWWRALVLRAESARYAAEVAEREHNDRIAAATESERARIAQELHDVAGQHLAGLITLADAALKIAPQHPDDAMRLVEDVRVEGRFAAASLLGALYDLRAVGAGPVEVTRDLRQLPELVAYWRQRGMSVETELDGTVEDLPAVVSTTAYRAVSEAFTNAAKHAPGARVNVSVTVEPRDLAIVIRNTAPVEGLKQTESVGLGWGLAGLRDRVELLQGALVSKPTQEDGWEVAVRLPVAAEL